MRGPAARRRPLCRRPLAALLPHRRDRLRQAAPVRATTPPSRADGLLRFEPERPAAEPLLKGHRVLRLDAPADVSRHDAVRADGGRVGRALHRPGAVGTHRAAAPPLLLSLANRGLDAGHRPVYAPHRTREEARTRLHSAVFGCTRLPSAAGCGASTCWARARSSASTPFRARPCSPSSQSVSAASPPSAPSASSVTCLRASTSSTMPIRAHSSTSWRAAAGSASAST
mmetsp:Transcript_4881/g.15584  ORF Transcript_4881/g.15584 Transcript_4881/m.15584 type:complete len:228 (+) Transcript_4881:245-928(+)